MGEYLRRCGAMEVDNGAVNSRAMEMEVASLSPSKRRKVDSQRLSSPENSVSVSPAASVDSTRTPATSFSSSQKNSTSTVKDRSGSLDLLNAKAQGFETDLSAFFISAFRVTTPLRKLCGDSKEMESSTVKKKKSSPAPFSERKPSTAKVPSAAEIEDFFSVAEKYEQKRFAEKYNYDIAKDVPLEGRYQWVRLKP